MAQPYCGTRLAVAHTLGMRRFAPSWCPIARVARGSLPDRAGTILPDPDGGTFIERAATTSFDADEQEPRWRRVRWQKFIDVICGRY